MSERRERLLELQERLRELAAQGQEGRVRDLCAECPELIEELEQQMRFEECLERQAGLPHEPGEAAVSGGYTIVPPQGRALVEGLAGPNIPVIPHHDILCLLGEGGMGAVYKGRDRRLERIVALKVIRDGQADLALLTRFRAEGQALADLQHTHIVGVHEIGWYKSTGGVELPYLALEFIEGKTLVEHLRRHLLTPEEAARLLLLLARAVRHAHLKGIIHRDLKPGNVMLGPRGDEPALNCVLAGAEHLPMLTDFGLARRVEGGAGLTRTGAVMGTPQYMAPEQAQGKKDVGPPADVYGLGGILYWLLTGQPPIQGADVRETLNLVCTEPPVPPRQLREEVPEVLEDLCLRCLEKDSAKRPSVAGLIEQMERFLAVESDAPTTPPAPARPQAGDLQVPLFRRAGVPWQSPPLPGHYVRRPVEELRLERDLLRQDEGPGVVVSAVFGLGGIGKTTLAAAVVQGQRVQERFPDGVLWMTLGQNPDLLSLVGRWIRDLGDHDFRAMDLRAASARLRQLLQERAVLLVVDDAWRSEHVEPFHAGAPKCRLLVTTRKAWIADHLHALRHELDVLDHEKAVELLAAGVGRSLRDDERGLARRLAEAVGRLPLPLELAAKRLGRGVGWDDLLWALEQEVASLEALEDPRERRQGKARLQASFNLSLRALRAEDEAAWRCFVWLGVLPDDTTLTAPMASAVWDVKETEAEEVLEYLWGEALLQPAGAIRVGAKEWRAYRIHDLLHDCARRLLAAPETSTRGEELPGLGLTRAKAHRELLERYRSRTRRGPWHTLVSDGYIHGRLGWHLEQAGDIEGLHALLREETAEGRNGWYEANERLGQPAYFADSVAQAWGLADKAFSTGGEILALGLQCRHALVTASLNSMAGNLPAELLVALVRQGVWPMEQALAYARKKPNAEAKAKALGALVPLVDPAERAQVLSEALRAARAIGDERTRSRTLAVLTPNLPEEVLAEALQVAHTIGDKECRSSALSNLAGYLPEQLLTEALQVAQTIEHEGWRSTTLRMLADHLPEQLLATALQVAQTIGDAWARSNALAVLAPRLPEQERAKVLAEAFQAALAIGDECVRSDALVVLAPHLPEEMLAEALQVALAIRVAETRSVTLMGLAHHLPEQERAQVLAEAFRAALAIGDELGRIFTLPVLIPDLPEEVLAKALQMAQAIGDEKARTDALVVLAPHLPEELVAEALQMALVIGDVRARSVSLMALAHRLPEEERAQVLAKAWQAALAIRDEEGRSDTLMALAPHLPEEERAQVLAEALQAAQAIREEKARYLTLAKLAPHLPEQLLAKALQVAQAIRDAEARSFALMALAFHLPEQERVQVLAEAWRAARAIGDEMGRSVTLMGLAHHLPEQKRAQVLAEAWQVALAIGDAGDRSRTLDALATLLPEQLLNDALKAARAIGDEEDSSRALAALATYLPDQERAQVLVEALRVAQTIRDAEARSRALAVLTPHLPEQERAQVLVEAWQAALAIGKKGARSRALAALAPHLPDQVTAPLLAEFWLEVPARGYEGICSPALAAQAPYLPEEGAQELVKAWQAALAIGSEWHCSDTLAALAPQLAGLPTPELASLWTQTLHRLAVRTRRDLLADLRSLTPVLAALAGPNAPTELREIAQAITDVARWWP
jgi:serine/threonine protein kinase